MKNSSCASSVDKAVPRYFFHLYNDVVARDEEGVQLADDAAARKCALVSAREMAAAEVAEGHLDLSHRIEVEDEAGRRVATVTFGDAVDVTP